MCKKCKKAFRKDMTAYEESDEYCPHCDNHYVGLSHNIAYILVLICLFRSMKVIEAKTPQAAIGIEGEDARIDARYAVPSPPMHGFMNTLRRLLKDERVQRDPARSLFSQDVSDRLG